MKNIVLTTSSSGLDNLNVKTDIQLIRLRIYVNNVEFIDGKNISSARLHRLMDQKGDTPVHTAPAPLEEVVAMFAKLQAQHYKKVFVTTLSSAISESYHIIKKAADSFKDHMDIYVYDCKELNVCEAFMALEAEQMMKEGISMPGIAARLDKLRRQHTMLYAIDDLSYLIKNKKLSVTAGFFANLVSLKPVLTVTDEGSIIPTKKIRKFKKALDHVVDSLDDLTLTEDTFVYLLTVGRSEVDNYMLKLIKERTHLSNIPIFPASSISLANHGPVGAGVCLFQGEAPYASKFFKKINY